MLRNFLDDLVFWSLVLIQNFLPVLTIITCCSNIEIIYLFSYYDVKVKTLF